MSKFKQLVSCMLSTGGVTNALIRVENWRITNLLSSRNKVVGWPPTARSPRDLPENKGCRACFSQPQPTDRTEGEKHTGRLSTAARSFTQL